MKKSWWYLVAWRLVRLAVLLYLVLLALVFFAQRKMIYVPAKGSFDEMEKFAAARGFQAWQGKSGYIGWKHIDEPARGRPQLLIIHGNAGCAADRINYADGLRQVQPMDVYILEYPGYGARLGNPSEKSFFAAGSEAIEQLRGNGPVYIMGESLGTGVAAYLAGTYPEMVRGMLLIAPYNNLAAVAASKMPIFPTRWLLLDRFASEDHLKNYHGPIAMLFAGQDVVVPNRFGHKLYDGYQGPKIFWQVPEAGHNDLLDEPDSRWKEIVQFWKTNAPPHTGP
ncbi:MAG TPA: alpha/beta hydrolase [Verrucomicrobiae bacterium]|nr:alpha/beta hydrolase [Verrucomicrobiae bacterium]